MLGLEIGGDDYVTKPFSPRELVARVNVILRRISPRNGEAKAGPAALAQGGLSIDPEQHVAAFAGTPLKLTAIEFGILRAFLTRPTSVFSREQMMRRPISSTSRSPTAPSTATSATSAPSSRRWPATTSSRPSTASASSSAAARKRHERGARQMAAVARPGDLHGAGDRRRAAAGRPVLLPPLRQPADPPDPGRADRAEPGAGDDLCAGGHGAARRRPHARRRDAARRAARSRRPGHADPSRARPHRQRPAAAAARCASRAAAGAAGLCRDRRKADADHPRDPEGDAGGLSHPRSARRGDRRARRRSGSRSPISRRSRPRCMGNTAPPCATACPTSRRRRSIPSAAASASTCSRRCPSSSTTASPG